MRFNISHISESRFATELFQIISDTMLELRDEAGKWPDRITFSGPLGKEVHSFIEKSDWDLKKFNPNYINGIVDKIIFDYSKPVDQIEDRGSTIFDGDLNNRTVQGIAGAETVQKILSSYSAPAFRIERQIRPKREIHLFKK